MKPQPHAPQADALPTNASPLKRRGLLLGAGAAGAAVLAARSLPGVGEPVAATVATATPAATAATAGDGYQVTAHVLRYYQTARL